MITTKYNIIGPNNRTEKHIKDKIFLSIDRFVSWLERFGEVSQDQYDFWATSSGQQAKSLYYRIPWLGSIAVAPFVFLDAFLPAARRWFWERQRFPIADAHFAMGFAFLYTVTGQTKYYQKAVHFLNVLKATRCPGYENYGWGYPFDWMTKTGLYKRFTPLITTTPYVYEAYAACFEIDGDHKLLDIMRSIALHVANDYHDEEIRENVWACSYIPRNKLANVSTGHVINANSYRAFMLADASDRFAVEEYWKIAQGNLNFVLESQRSDGSWFYATDANSAFIDHFHTCFVLKNLIKIERLTGHTGCRDAIKRGNEFYFAHLLDENDLPKPFAKTQRMTTFRRDLYDFAESINLALLQMGNYKEFRRVLESQLSHLLSHWQRSDGSFRTRQLLLGWNNVPYHRWAQSQLFRSLCFLLHKEKEI